MMNSVIDYSSLYNEAYRRGYHKGFSDSRAPRFVRFLLDTASFDSVLDVGCARGWAVKQFLDAGKHAMGVDASLEPIIDRGALDLRWGTATDLPFDDGQFEAVVSTDMMEHLAPDDVPVAIREFLRVASHCTAHQIATRPAGHPRTREWFDNINPHLTVRPIDWWVEMFERVGWKLWKRKGNIILLEK